MAKISKYFILLFLVLTGLALSACSNDNVIPATSKKGPVQMSSMKL